MILHSQIIGEGKPFLILHGFLGMGDNWKTLGNQFAEAGFQIHLIDQRNHGRSFHSNEMNYEGRAGDLKKYMEKKQLENAIILGHSMGGKTAMTFAVKFSELVSKLIVADISPKAYPVQHQDLLDALSRLDFSEIKSRGEAEDVLSKEVKNEGTRLFLLKNLYWESKGKLGLRMNLPVLSEEIEAVGEPLPNNTVFKGETLFLGGAKSNYISSEDEVLIKKHFPTSEIQTIPNAGHWLHAENPSAFYEAVMAFLSE